MASTVMIKASGLQTSPNELGREEGALIEAKNIIIKRDNIIESRRGFAVYGTQLPDITERVKQLTSYRNRILRHYANKLQYDFDGAGTFRDFIGNFLETQAGLRMKFIEANGNFYFTTSDGVKKISAKSPSDFSRSDAIYSAGAVKAIDFSTKTIYTANQQSGFLPQDASVSYRVVWGYKDINNNLVLGAPSQRVVAGNPMIELLLRDYIRLLSPLDMLVNSPLTAARINDKNYVATLGLPLNSSPAELHTSIVALATKLDNDIFYADQGAVAPLQINSASVSANIATVVFVSGNPQNYFVPGSKIFLGGGWLAPSSTNIAGERIVVSVTPTTITFNVTAPDGTVSLTSPTINSNEYRSIPEPLAPALPATNDDLVAIQTYFTAILDRLLDEPTAVIETADKALFDAVDITTSSTVQITITIPEGVDSKYFYQVYRSSIAQALGPSSFDDVVPSDELQLVFEAFPTTEEIAAAELTFTDVTPDAFRGANLYTNASTGEGILQANDPPPFAKDVNRYRNSVFYANTRTLHRLSLNLLGVTNMIQDFDLGVVPKVTVADSARTNTYNFVVGLQEIIEIETVADVVGSLNSKYFLLNSTTGRYYVWFNVGGLGVDPMVADRIGLEVSLVTNDSANTVATKLKDAIFTLIDQFIVSAAGNVVEVVCFDVGEAPDSVDVDTTFTITNTQQGRGERVQPEKIDIQAIAGSLFASSGVSDYFILNEPFDQKSYYIFFKYGTSTDPAIMGKIGIPIIIDGTETADQIAALIAAIIPDSFSVGVNSSLVSLTAVQYGQTTPASEVVADLGFTVTVTQEGALDVLLSPLPSPAQAVDQTARSFIRVLNKNPGESVYASYLSSAFDVPGKIFLESRDLTVTTPFYVVGNNVVTGESFNPDISPEVLVTSISASSLTVLTTAQPHGLTTGEEIVITNSDSAPIVDGLYKINYVSPTSFSIDKTVNVAGTTASFVRTVNAVFSENETRPNRVYYSKFLQPDAVPISNFFDVGAADMEILRIFPLRDSLFVFKQDGLYRISGEGAPFQLELFDNSFIVVAPDSVAVSNNIIYAWTTQGIQSLSEGGSSIISRSIDNILLRLQSSNFAGFSTATWGIGYESDNSYLVFTVDETSDTFAKRAYRYSTLTNTWTTYEKSSVAGVVNFFDDKLYLAASDIPDIEQERKTFSRLDYADRQYPSSLASNNYFNNRIILPDVTNVSVGDVILQDQTITTYEFNALLEKLDYDPGVADSNYFGTLQLVAGGSPRNNLVALAQKLDLDATVASTNYLSTIAALNGTITSVSQTNPAVITSVGHGLLTGRVVQIDSSDSVPSVNGQYQVTVIDADRFSIPVNVLEAGSAGNWQTVNVDFQDLKTCYNRIIGMLNADAGVSFTNYSIIDNNTIQEAIILDINRITRTVTVNLVLDFVFGALTVYKAIPVSYTYSQITMGDPLNYKHLREATLMMETRNITTGSLSFATDLLPAFQKVPFTLEGNGIFGHSQFGEGFFGGIASSAPFRTYIPRQCMRCRFIIVQFQHSVAREDFKILGLTITGEIGQSTRAYR